MKRSLRRWLAAPALGLVACAAGGVATENACESASPGAEAASGEIRREALLPGVGRSGTHPLPLVAGWDAGDGGSGSDPGFQLRQIANGHHLLPWFRLPHPVASYDLRRHDAAVRCMAALGLPIAFVSLEWEQLLEAQYGDRIDGSKSAAARGADGRRKLSPLTPVRAWQDAGRRWGSHPMLRHVAALYPEPPLVLFVSNNEQSRFRWRELAAVARAATGDHGADDATLRRWTGDLWIERYRALQGGFRDALDGAAWRPAARFVGYDAIGPAALGRWAGWIDYSLIVAGRAEPWPLAWDGASASFYVDDWSPASDYQVRSPQVEAMNWVPMLADAYRLNPDFWFELSVWDGQQPGQATDKAAAYARLGQAFGPARYAGMVQYGMWLLRPRLVREFRNPGHGRAQFGPYFDAIMAAVDRVWREPELSRFWRDGRLVADADAVHPYVIGVTPALVAGARWFMLPADANPDRPWALDTPLRLYSLALELGTPPQREWLVYAHSPLDARLTARVRLPGGRQLQIAATPGGCFSIAREAGDSMRQLSCG